MTWRCSVKHGHNAWAVRGGPCTGAKQLTSVAAVQVKVAEHILTGHKVAIKILNRKKIKQMDMDEKGEPHLPACSSSHTPRRSSVHLATHHHSHCWPSGP